MMARILVVEDNSESLSALVKLLEINEFYVKGVDGYQSALEAAQQEHFDLLLIDIGLWDGDGCDLFGDLKRKHHLDGIAVTGYGQPDDVQRCLDAGFKSHILKPISLPKLLESIADVLNERTRRVDRESTMQVAASESFPA